MSEENKKENVELEANTDNKEVATMEKKLSVKERYQAVCTALVEAKKSYNLAKNACLDDPKNKDLKKAKRSAWLEVKKLQAKKNAVWAILVAVIGTAAAIAFGKAVAKQNGEDFTQVEDVESAPEVSE